MDQPHACDKAEPICGALILTLYIGCRLHQLPEVSSSGMKLTDAVHMVVCDYAQRANRKEAVPKDLTTAIAEVQTIMRLGAANSCRS